MPKKKTLRLRLVSAREALSKFLRTLYHGDDTSGGPWRLPFNVVKVFIVSGRKFMRDDCFTKASSITYTIILSLVPALTVGLTIYSTLYRAGASRNELIDRLLLFLAERDISLSVDPLLDALMGLVDNAAKIGGISAAVMIFSATAMLRSLEKSMNDIWRVDRGRPIIKKIVYYWAALTLGPIILAAGMTAAVQLSSVLSSPHYRAAQVAADRTLWVVGDRATIVTLSPGDGGFRETDRDRGTIDYDNQRVFAYNPETKVFVEREAPLDPREVRKTAFMDVQFIGNTGWIVGSGGIMLYTHDGGALWHIRKYGNFNFNDIQMLGEERGFIAADGGVLLSTMNGGATWEVSEYAGRPDYRSIAFYGARGIVTGSAGAILRTEDGGTTWEPALLSDAARNNRPVTINGAFYINERQIWLLGDRGLLLHTVDGGATWTPTFKERSVHSAYFFNPNEGVIGGDDGLLLRTVNAGRSWNRGARRSMGIRSIRYGDGILWAVGDAGRIMASRDRGATWETVRSGRSFWYSLINFMAPFTVIWVLFLLAYITIPNTRVPFRPAAIGASFTSAVWVAFILLFILYIKGFAQVTMAVYGALAAIPLFLLMVYASSFIILLGAEVSYTLMHPDTYRSLKEAFGDRERIHVYYALLLLRRVYRKFESGGGSTGEKELRGSVEGKSAAIGRYLRLLMDEKLLVRDGNGDYLPGKSPDGVRIDDLIDAVLGSALDMPVHSGRSLFRTALGELFGRIRESRRKAVGGTTLKDLMDKE